MFLFVNIYLLIIYLFNIFDNYFLFNWNKKLTSRYIRHNKFYLLLKLFKMEYYFNISVYFPGVHSDKGKDSLPHYSSPGETISSLPFPFAYARNSITSMGASNIIYTGSSFS